MRAPPATRRQRKQSPLAPSRSADTAARAPSRRKVTAATRPNTQRVCNQESDARPRRWETPLLRKSCRSGGEGQGRGRERDQPGRHRAQSRGRAEVGHSSDTRHRGMEAAQQPVRGTCGRLTPSRREQAAEGPCTANTSRVCNRENDTRPRLCGRAAVMKRGVVGLCEPDPNTEELVELPSNQSEAQIQAIRAAANKRPKNIAQ